MEWVRINCAYQYIPTGVKKYSVSKKYFNGSINYDNITPEQECLFNVQYQQEPIELFTIIKL
ncbi:hypothetical protein HYD81_02935 [Mycoplasmopsis bovis]|nr:hypothetical protein HYD81_02935 [Mycoplasmopsis bovis]